VTTAMFEVFMIEFLSFEVCAEFERSRSNA